MINLSAPKNQERKEYQITIQGKTYAINYAYDNVLRWLKLNHEDNLSDREKLTQTILMFVGAVRASADDCIKLYGQVAETVFKTPYGNSDKPQEPLTKDEELGQYLDRPYDFDIDADAIYASFMYDYHINLLDEKGKLSWFEFKALLDNLSPKSPLMRIVSIRQEDPSDYKDSPEAQVQLINQQEYYSLAQTDYERELRKQYNFAKAFMAMEQQDSKEQKR